MTVQPIRITFMVSKQGCSKSYDTIFGGISSFARSFAATQQDISFILLSMLYRAFVLHSEFDVSVLIHYGA